MGCGFVTINSGWVVVLLLFIVMKVTCRSCCYYVSIIHCFFILSGSTIGDTNIQGEEQKKLDIIANDLFINMLKSSFEASY